MGRGLAELLATVASLAFGFAPITALAEPAEPAEALSTRPPNLLLITVDSLRADHVGAYGYAKAKTRILDQLARVGARFERALTPFPRSTPALASLFTGLRPQHHGSRGAGVPFTSGTTLAEVLSAQGYEAFAVSSTPVAGHKQHFDRGFRRFYSPAEDIGPYRATTTTDLALALAARGSSDRPQFLWVHYFDPHFPYQPPSGFPDSPAAPACRRLIQQATEETIARDHVHSNWGRAAERSRSECIELYDASIHYTDLEIGRLLVALGKAEFLKSVVIVVTAPQGESFGEAGLYYQHGASVHGAVLRIPLLISAAEIAAKRVVTDLFSLEDLMPTLLGLLGVKRDAWPSMDGHNYSARLTQAAHQPSSPTAVFSESANTSKPPVFAMPFAPGAVRDLCQPGAARPGCDRFGGAGEFLAAIMKARVDVESPLPAPGLQAVRRAMTDRMERNEGRQRSITTKRFKLVQAPRVSGGVQRALFDLASDRSETADVSALHPEILEELSRKLDQWLETIPPGPPKVLDASDREMLRKLGYAD